MRKMTRLDSITISVVQASLEIFNDRWRRGVLKFCAPHLLNKWTRALVNTEHVPIRPIADGQSSLPTSLDVVQTCSSVLSTAALAI